MNTLQITKHLSRVETLLGHIKDRIKSFRLIRFGGLLVNDEDLDHMNKSSYYPGNETDLNKYVRVGYWDYDSDYSNVPDNHGGYVEIIHSQSVIIQMANSRESAHVSKRWSTDGGEVWTPWEQMISMNLLPTRKYQEGTLAETENIIRLTVFSIDAANPDSHMLFVDGIYMMHSVPCNAAGDVMSAGQTSYIKISDTFDVDLPYKVYNSTSVVY